MRAKPRLTDAERAAQEQAALNFPGLPARLAAIAITGEVVTTGHSLDERFTSEPTHPRLVHLDQRDRSLARSIATVSLRRLGSIRQALAKLLERGMPKGAGTLEWILVTGAAQILFLDVPDHAAVDLCVRAARLDPKALPFAALVNGTLRNLAREGAAALNGINAPVVDTPAWLAARWHKHYGSVAAADIAAAHGQEPTLDITVKDRPEYWAQLLGAVVLPTGSIRLNSHTPISELPGYGEGEWWVQDAAAAIPARLLRAGPGMRVADLCAAPGGKTAQLALTGAQVFAVDRSAERLKRLAVNMERLRLSVETLVADAATFRAPAFDAILVDAPCSSTGTIRRHPDVAWTKRAADLQTLSTLQVRILDHAASLLLPHGKLVYCVCSLEPEEGEMQVAALLRRNPDMERLAIAPHEVGGLAECLNANGELRTLPCHMAASDPRLAGMDGFFAARLRRRNGTSRQ